MNYVVACLTLFNDGTTAIRIRARGQHINKAVDTIGLLRRVFLPNLKVVEAETGTDILTRTDGNQAHVSILEIVITAS